MTFCSKCGKEIEDFVNFCKSCGNKIGDVSENIEKDSREVAQVVEHSGGGGFIVFLILIIIGLLIWGYIGGQEASNVGVTCDMGIGDTFCFKWHTNTLGQIEEGVANMGNAIKDIFN